LGEQREADGQTCGNARPPKRGDGPFHLFLAELANDLVNDRCRRSGSLLDLLDFAPIDVAIVMLVAGPVRPSIVFLPLFLSVAGPVHEGRSKLVPPDIRERAVDH